MLYKELDIKLIMYITYLNTNDLYSIFIYPFMKNYLLIAFPTLFFGTLLFKTVPPSYQAFLSLRDYKCFIKRLKYSEVIKEVKTPEQAKRYLTEYLSVKADLENYGVEDYVASFKKINEKGVDDCDGGALAAAALLRDDEYPSLMLCMFRKEHSLEHHGGHAVFIYQVNGKWGTLGIKEVDCEPPQYSSAEEIVRSYRVEKFNVINIEEQYPNWIDIDINMVPRIYRPDLAKEIAIKDIYRPEEALNNESLWP
jgi:hypothetical protein